MGKEDRIFVREGPVTALLTYTIELLQIKALHMSLSRNEHNSWVIEIERYGADLHWRYLQHAHALQSVRAENVNVFQVNWAEVLSTSWKLYSLSVLHVVLIELFEVWVQDMVQADVISQGHCHVVSTWVKCAWD